MNLIIALLFLLQPSPLPQKDYQVKVVSIADGDTFSFLSDNKKIRVRIEAIDAPEKGMPFYKSAKEYLSGLCGAKFVKLKIINTDRYGRFVARVTLADGRDVSSEMIKAGMAWHYKQYSSDKRLAALEDKARRNHIGLWHDKNARAPWEVRKERRKLKKKKSGHKS
ncbi:MAG TPA: thermonuclease family protein [Flavobacterium sp.]|jgi:endonuclease YncB( thermonuclease family)